MYGLISALLTTSTALVLSAAATAQSGSSAPEAPPTPAGVAPHQAAPPHSPDAAAEHRAATAQVGEKAPDFTLTGADDKIYKLSDFAGKLVVLEWINPGCPVCRGVMDDGRVASMISGVKAEFPDAVFLMINSTYATREKPEESASYLAKSKITAPALIDGDGQVGHLYGARTTPALYVIDPAGILRYAGALDNDESGDMTGSAQKATNYVVSAAAAIKSGTEVSPSKTKSYGCGVKYEGGRKKRAPH
ncbi:MAG: redoxin domain-containing protein [Phycisphaerales bacterium]|nr:redoxin domain-containing protein [Phycisphaerales bacterium]